MHIPLYDVSVGKYKTQLMAAIERIIDSGQYISGNDVINFEQKWAEYCGYRYAVGVNSGTSAIEALIRSHHLKGKIIVPVNTYSATAMAVCNAGCEPVFVDCDERYSMDMEKVQEIVERTDVSAMIPVHLYGIPADMTKANRIAESNDLVIIEDAAQAHGLKVDGANDKAYSFYPTKNLGAFGDGGAVVTNSEYRASWIEKWRNQGRITGNTFNHEIIGTNSRLDSIQAAVLNVKLDYLDTWNKHRSDIAGLYNDLLTDVILPLTGVYHFYVIRVKNRDEVMEKLKENGIGYSIHYPVPLHLQHAFRHLGYKKGDFPIAEKFSKEILSLPMSPYLSQDEVKTVCSCVNGGM